MLVDLQGNILYVNKAIEDLLHYDKEELLGQSCEILACNNCFGHNITKEGKRCALFRKGAVTDLHCSFKKKGGARVKVLKNATVLTDKEGNVVGGVETLTDLTAVINQEKEIYDLRKELNRENGFHGLIGNSSIMQQVYELIQSAAPSSAPIIIYGESGTGKELVANAIHTLSKRSDAPFIKVNCAALNENILESELFGHAKGAFTGADRDRTGRFEAANTGSIFLDEIADLALPMQTKLLRVLQEQEVERVGDHQPIPIDVRVISATNKKLSNIILEHKFREDLFYRLGVIPINIPPLRQHSEDIPLLVKTFIDRSNFQRDKEISTIRKDALDLLVAYQWPGNIRELINVLEYTFVICPEGEITPQHLPLQFQKESSVSPLLGQKRASNSEERRDQLLQALNETNGNKSAAARLLGISRVTLWKHLKKYNITMDRSSY